MACYRYVAFLISHNSLALTFWKLGRAPIAYVQTQASEAALVAEIVREQSGVEIYVSLKTKSFYSQGWSQELVRGM